MGYFRLIESQSFSRNGATIEMTPATDVLASSPVGLLRNVDTKSLGRLCNRLFSTLSDPDMPQPTIRDGDLLGVVFPSGRADGMYSWIIAKNHGEPPDGGADEIDIIHGFHDGLLELSHLCGCIEMEDIPELVG